MLKTSTNSASVGIALLLGCAVAGCAQRPAVRSPALPPAVEAIGRPQLAGLPATSAPTDQTSFARLADGACGLAGGCLVGACRSNLDGHRLDLARKADEHSKLHPAVPAEAREAKTADLNGDGFVTLDELIAMRRAGLDDPEIIDRLKATGQVFSLSPRQWQYLYDRGINQPVLDWMSGKGPALAAAAAHIR